MSVPLPPLNLNSTDMASFATGAVQTGATFNFAKPASATGVDLSFNAGWLLLAGAGLFLFFVLKSKGG